MTVSWFSFFTERAISLLRREARADGSEEEHLIIFFQKSC